MSGICGVAADVINAAAVIIKAIRSRGETYMLPEIIVLSYR